MIYSYSLNGIESRGTAYTAEERAAHTASHLMEPPSGGISHDPLITPLGPGQAILARNNRPLVDMFFRLLESGIEVRIEGTEFAEKIKRAHELFLRRDSSRGISLASYRSTVAREGYDRAEEYRREGRKWKAARTLDDTNSWLRVIDFAIQTPAKNLERTVGKSPFGPKPDFTGPRTSDTVSKVLAYMLRVSSDNDDAREKMITLSTIHKAKGLEWDVVWWFGFDALHPSKFAVTAEEKQQERNLEYVAGTRSRGPVYLVPLEK